MIEDVTATLEALQGTGRAILASRKLNPPELLMGHGDRRGLLAGGPRPPGTAQAG